MTTPDPLAQLRKTLADAHVLLTAHRNQIEGLTRRLDQAGIGPGSNLMARFEELAATVAEALDAATPAGPPSPNWDTMGADERARCLAALTKWVRRVLVPGWVTAGGFALADCWAQHEQALWELGALHTQYRRIYERPRPQAALALELHDRWIPGALRRIADATRNCNMGHTPNSALPSPVPDDPGHGTIRNAEPARYLLARPASPPEGGYPAVTLGHLHR